MNNWRDPIAIIGAGQLGSALMEGLLLAGIDPALIRVATGNPEHAEQLAARHKVTAASAAQAVDRAALVVIAVRPNQVTSALDEIAPHLTNQPVVLSMAGDPDHATLSAHLPAGVPVMRIMPNPAMAVGAGTIAWFTPLDFPADTEQRLRALFERLGTVIDLDESRFWDFAGLMSHAQAVYYYAAQAATQWGVLKGFAREDAKQIVAAAMVGAGQALSESGQDAIAWQNRLCTPGGSTIRTVAALEERGVAGAIINALDGGEYRGR